MIDKEITQSIIRNIRAELSLCFERKEIRVGLLSKRYDDIRFQTNNNFFSIDDSDGPSAHISKEWITSVAANLNSDGIEIDIFPSGGGIPKKIYDIFFGVWPVGSPSSLKSSISSSVKSHAIEGLLLSLFHISEDGFGVFALMYDDAFKHHDLSSLLEKENFFLNGVIRLPQWCFVDSHLRLILVIVSHHKTDRVFFLELDERVNKGAAELRVKQKCEAAIRHIFECVVVEKIRKQKISSVGSIDVKPFMESFSILKGGVEEGIFMPLSDFQGFEQIKNQEKLQNLKSDFHGQTKVKLKEFVTNYFLGRKGVLFEAQKTCLYVPMIGIQPCGLSLEEVDLGNQNVCQLFLDETKVRVRYLQVFLNSPFGELLLSIAKNKNDRLIPRMNIKDLLDVEVPLPDLGTQDLILERFEKSQEVLRRLNEISLEIALNPISFNEGVEQIENVYSAIATLSDYDKARSALRRGEDSRTEFKQTFSYDVKLKKQNDALRMVILKSLTALMNRDGGILLIGVDDGGNIVGIADELRLLHEGSEDKFQLTFSNVFREYIGPEYNSFIDFKIISIAEKKICMIECMQSDSSVWFRKNEFYIRGPAQNVKLDGKELHEYLQRRFPR
jgi:hypothetical protein